MRAEKLNLRKKSVLAGLYLSKFDFDGLKYLGFNSFAEAFNAIGLAMEVAPMSIKNYRDEFDPFFPNNRKGWHKREIRKYCQDIYDNFSQLDLINFSTLLKDIIYKNRDLDLLMERVEIRDGNENSSFAKRLITGQAAEQYFKNNFLSIDLFKGYVLEDTTQFGCGFDFKLSTKNSSSYYGVEVKGLNEQSGNISLTNKEYIVAELLKENYFLFVVKNFKEKPVHSIYQNPITNMSFKKNENTITQINWSSFVC